MPLLEGASEETIRRNVQELIDAGRDPSTAAAIAYHYAHPGHRHDAGDWYCKCQRFHRRVGGVVDLHAYRMDAELARNLTHTVDHVRMHRAVGSARRRTGRTPKPRWPKAVEVAYAKQLVDATGALRRAFEPLLKALPDLLARAARERGDAADGGAFLERDLEAPRPDKKLVAFAGLPIVIENPRGSVRYWKDDDGAVGATTMLCDYGYVRGMIGDDGEDVDVYVSPSAPPTWDGTAYAIAQRKKSDGYRSHDEHKVMLGFDSQADACAAYLAHRDDPRALGNVVAMPVAEFRRRLVARERIPSPHRHDISEADRARALVDQARAYLERVMSPSYIEALAKKMGVRVSDVNLEDLRRQTRSALGVALTAPDKSLGALLDHFAHENTSLITSLSSDVTSEIEKMVTRAITSGTRHEKLAEDIQNRFGVADRHARMIARDQVGKLYGQLARSRHRELGVGHFIWRTVGDQRVRDEHIQFQQQSLAKPFSYDDPPVDRTGQAVVPGEPVCCRCGSEPVFDQILDAIDAADLAA